MKLTMTLNCMILITIMKRILAVSMLPLTNSFKFLNHQKYYLRVRVQVIHKYMPSRNISNNISSEIRRTILYTVFFFQRRKKGSARMTAILVDWSTNEAQTFPMKFAPKLILLPSTVNF